MIRTVIQQKNSFTITLPKKWASKHDLKDKDPLRIEENEFSNKLLISPLNTVMEEKPETIIDVEHLDYNDVLIVVNQSYRLGYNKIKLTNINKNILHNVEDIASLLVGFTSSTSSNTVTYEMLNTDQYDPKQVNTLLRKLFFIIEQTYTENQKELDGLKQDMDTHTNYLRRTIAKHDHGGKTSYQYYSLTNKLALVQHAIYRSRKYSKDRNIKQLLDRSYKLLQFLERGLFENNIDTLSQVNDQAKIVNEQIDKHIKQHPQPHIRYLYEQVRMIEMCVPSAKGIVMNNKCKTIINN